MLTQTEDAGVLVERGALVDAAIVQSARKTPPKGETGGDKDARWAVKDNQPTAHGFKAHIAVDDGSEIVRAIETTNGSVHVPCRWTDCWIVRRLPRCMPMRLTATRRDAAACAMP